MSSPVQFNALHFVLAIIWQRNLETQEIEFLVIDSVSTNPRDTRKTPKQVKFPGGCQRVADESVDLTLQREVLEETHLAVLPGNAQEIWQHQANPTHVKYGFLVPFAACRGELRKEVLHDNGDEMSPPYWVAAHVLGRTLYQTHQNALLAACRALGVL